MGRREGAQQLGTARGRGRRTRPASPRDHRERPGSRGMQRVWHWNRPPASSGLETWRRVGRDRRKLLLQAKEEEGRLGHLGRMVTGMGQQAGSLGHADLWRSLPCVPRDQAAWVAMWAGRCIETGSQNPHGGVRLCGHSPPSWNGRNFKTEPQPAPGSAGTAPHTTGDQGDSTG